MEKPPMCARLSVLLEMVRATRTAVRPAIKKLK